MRPGHANPVLRYIRQLAAATTLPEMADWELLESFILSRDEAAFAALVRRHGPMVRRLCLRVLHHEQDAEDAFQATFLVLSRKADALRPRESLAGWLHCVAYRTAQKARISAARRRKHESAAAVIKPRPAADPLARISVLEAQELLDQELVRLPDKFRVPLVLCYLEGLTRDEAAHRLGWQIGLLKSRLEQARERLEVRLVARGLGLAGALVAGLFREGNASAAVPHLLLDNTVKAATAIAGSSAAASLVPLRVAALTEGVVKAMFMTKLKMSMLGLLVLSALSLGVGLYTQRVLAGNPESDAAPALERGRGDAIRLPPEMLTKLGIQVAEVKARTAQPRVIQMFGSTAIDPEGIARIRGRFAPFEVLEIGKPDGKDRQLRPGDNVRKGQVLAVVSSAAVGKTKHGLFDALVQLNLDLAILERAERAANSVPEVILETARRNVQGGRNAIARANAAFENWRIPVNDIAAIIQEAREAGDNPKTETAEMRKARLERWAKVELRSPVDGAIVETNVSQHEIVTDGARNLFQIANLDRLLVFANVSEEDLPSLQALKVSERRWTVRPIGSDEDRLRRYGTTFYEFEKALNVRPIEADPDRLRRNGTALSELEKALANKSAAVRLERPVEVIGPVVDTPVEGAIDDIGSIIDPNEHTAVVKGYIDNKKHQLRAGQLITATVVLPPLPVSEVVLPSAALVEEGRHTFVFIQSDAKKFLYEQRHVVVVRRGKDAVHIRARLTAEEDRQGFQTVRPGEHVVTSGALELKGILDDLKAMRDR